MIYDVDELAELYLKLKGSIFLRLVPYQYHSVANEDIKQRIQRDRNADPESEWPVCLLNRDMTFEEFYKKWM